MEAAKLILQPVEAKTMVIWLKSLGLLEENPLPLKTVDPD
jgi:hypothetical protein